MPFRTSGRVVRHENRGEWYLLLNLLLFFVTWCGPYFVKNVLIAFLNPELQFLMPQSIWTTTQPGLQKLKPAATVVKHCN